ncbi:hypothetical protein IGI04_040432 [Brassica rapa subsp. trilocularis]|uniref:Uncharacterized protein n=1 Tax=Brassica rapa subsp. trilocularis TaxID=1813537 RepID=A0ABQ7KQS6_BRACM|nr:hypothetical protein IGI04_040432 [Brassica rapa subsp. trilocularis]
MEGEEKLISFAQTPEKERERDIKRSSHIESCKGVHGLGENGFNSATRVLRVTPYDTGSRQVSAIHWRRVIEFTRRKAERNHFLSFLKKTRVSVREAISRATPTFLQFSPSNRRRSVSSTSSGEYRFASLVQMDPAEERRDRKRQQEYFNMLGNVADSQYRIPRRFPCGGRIIDEVRVKEEYDTLPGKRFFTCINYEADGFHYRQPWVIGVQEEMERLRKPVEEAEQVIKWVPNLNKQIESVEAQVKRLTLLLDNLTSDVYNLTVQVDDLEKLETPPETQSKIVV